MILTNEISQGWQQKLSQLDVARFPWDPKPEPAPPAQAAPPPQATAPAQITTQNQFSPQLPLPNAGTPGAAPQNGIKQEPGYNGQEGGIKQEPGAQAPGLPLLPSYNGMDNKNSVAASRAAQQLQLQYGIRAAGSINAIQDRMGQQQQQGGQSQDQSGQPSGDASNNFSNGQTDGAGDAPDDDFEGVLMQRNAAGTLDELGRVDIDRMMHARIAAKAKSMEGGGLMLPLKEATKRVPSGPASSSKRVRRGVAAFDGGDDDEDIDDEDAINSDLDDPEEDHDDDEVDDEGLGHIMLCMYDKVQRVKNKW